MQLLHRCLAGLKVIYNSRVPNEEYYDEECYPNKYTPNLFRMRLHCPVMHCDAMVERLQCHQTHHPRRRYPAMFFWQWQPCMLYTRVLLLYCTVLHHSSA
jgi:hypothetical protein